MFGEEVKLEKKSKHLWHCPEHDGDVGFY